VPDAIATCIGVWASVLRRKLTTQKAERAEREAIAARKEAAANEERQERA
jgi:hypothetical protein